MMKNSTCSVILATGSYIPKRRIRNEDFLESDFYDSNGKKLGKSNREIISKFLEITAIEERRYVIDEHVTSDIAYFAALDALESSKTDKEELDYIIVAHNFGDVKAKSKSLDIVPSLAARVKHKLGIENPATIAYDLPFGCPGWLQGIIQADYYLRSGDAKRILVIGADVLSRISDPHDRDSMLYADGAGATILEARSLDTDSGILSHSTRSDTMLHSQMLFMGKSYNPDLESQGEVYLKMHGRKLYQYALERVPQAIKDCLDKSGVDLKEVKKILIHQANGKMDDAIIERLYKLYGLDEIPEYALPMTISWLGNASVATIPTLLDLILKGEMEDHNLESGDLVVFASVGAGMNINAVVYRF
jgi:3-oxoacyl-[acyl-carrier-protein] synthase-3